MCKNNTKFRTDMYSDTKMKIINTLEERDLIFYVWHRIVNLATIVNDNGYLYITKNMPYTIDTLAIEFDRSSEQIIIALNIFLKLEMIENINGKIFRVKSWSKYNGNSKTQTSDYETDLNKESDNIINNNEKSTDENKKIDLSTLTDILPELKSNIEIKEIVTKETKNNNEDISVAISNETDKSMLKDTTDDISVKADQSSKYNHIIENEEEIIEENQLNQDIIDSENIIGYNPDEGYVPIENFEEVAEIVNKLIKETIGDGRLMNKVKEEELNNNTNTCELIDDKSHLKQKNRERT